MQQQFEKKTKKQKNNNNTTKRCGVHIFSTHYFKIKTQEHNVKDTRRHTNIYQHTQKQIYLKMNVSFESAPNVRYIY